MKNIFIFLEDKLNIKFFIIKSFILITIFFPKSLYALSGEEINNYIKKWLETEDIKSNPQFSPKKNYLIVQKMCHMKNIMTVIN